MVVRLYRVPSPCRMEGDLLRNMKQPWLRELSGHFWTSGQRLQYLRPDRALESPDTTWLGSQRGSWD